MFEILLNHYPALVEGLTTTLVVSLSAIAFGLVLGVLLAFGLMSRYRLYPGHAAFTEAFGEGRPSCCNCCWSTTCCRKWV